MTKPPSLPTSAEDLDVLLGAAYPEANERRAQLAARHRRKARSVGPQRLLKDVIGESAAKREGKAGPRTYLHSRPTRSAVLNAFLVEMGETFSARARVPSERAFAFELFGIARPYLLRMLLRDNVEAALRLASELQAATNEGMARLALPQAARAGAGELMAIARDHEARRAVVAADDLLLSCMVATFAARIVVYAERLQGPQVREDALAAIRLLLNRKGVSASRAASVREATPLAGPVAAVVAAPAGAVRRPMTKRGESVTARGQAEAPRAESTGTRRSR